jgi:hypothetical protein
MKPTLCWLSSLALTAGVLMKGTGAEPAQTKTRPVLAAPPVSAASSKAGFDSNQVQQVQWRGRVVCLPEVMHVRFGAELPTRHQHVWAFQTTNGNCYTLLEGKFSEAIFLDERVRARELEIKGRLFPQAHALELTFFHSVKNGVVQNLYYYCEICAIATVSPEPCACCQAPVELVEKPASEGDE